MVIRAEAGELNCILSLTIDPGIDPCPDRVTSELRAALSGRPVPEIVHFLVPEASTVHPERMSRIIRCVRNAVQRLHPTLCYAHLHVVLCAGRRRTFSPLYEKVGPPRRP